MDGGEHVIARDALGDEDRVLEIVPVPRHEGDEHVATQCQFAQLGGRTVGDDVALGHPIAHLHQRALVDAGALVGTHELAQTIDVHALGRAVLGGGAHHDAGAIDLVDDAGALGDDGRTRVTGHGRFHAGANQRRIGAHQRHGLTHHVGAHQRAVRVIVLKERDERGRDRDELLRRHVDRCHVLWLHQAEIALLAHRHEIGGELAIQIHLGVSLGDDELLLLHGGEIDRVALHDAVLHQHVGGFDKAVFVNFGERCQRVDEADIRAFRRLDGADAAIMGRVHVAHLKAGALTGQTARAQR